MVTKKMILYVVLICVAAFILMQAITFLSLLMIPIWFLLKLAFWGVVIYIIGYFLVKKIKK